MKDCLRGLLRDLKIFSNERDWGKFHSPKNLAMALVVEVAELAEHFQWLSSDESKSFPYTELTLVGEEIADVFIYLLYLSDALGVDLIATTRNKMEKNRGKYPLDRLGEEVEDQLYFDFNTE